MYYDSNINQLKQLILNAQVLFTEVLIHFKISVYHLVWDP